MTKIRPDHMDLAIAAASTVVMGSMTKAANRHAATARILSTAGPPGPRHQMEQHRSKGGYFGLGQQSSSHDAELSDAPTSLRQALGHVQDGLYRPLLPNTGVG